MSLGRAAISLARPIGELLFPQQCSACGASSGGWLCDACRQSLLELASFPRCGTCALPVAEPDAPCPRCEGRPGRLIATVACLGTHSGVLRHLIHQFKYAHRWTFARPLAQWLAQQMTVQIVLSQADAIVPIPLHWRRRITRGYNQSQLLADALGTDAGVRVAEVLLRVRDTAHQTAIRALTQRARNVRGAFRVGKAKAKEVIGRRIVLVDDVFTTGATLRSAARELRSAGAARVDAVVLAMADPRNRDFRTI